MPKPTKMVAYRDSLMGGFCFLVNVNCESGTAGLYVDSRDILGLALAGNYKKRLMLLENVFLLQTQKIVPDVGGASGTFSTAGCAGRSYANQLTTKQSCNNFALRSTAIVRRTVDTV
jgi:hypothetical protein